MIAAFPREIVTHVAITGTHLGVDELVAVARGGAAVHLSPEALLAIDASFAALRARVASGEAIYGLTTGVGALDGEAVDPADARRQRSLLRSHAAGVGEAMAVEEVRAMMLARLNTLARGKSGVQPSTAEALVLLLNRGVVPFVPSVGSVGASDLAPLSHMALVLAGEGQAAVDGPFVPAAQALERAGIAPPRLGYRDALALINGVAFTTGVGALAIADLERLIAAAEVATAMTVLAAGGADSSFEARVVQSAQPGVIASAARLRELLDGRAPGERPMREPLSTRSAHHVAGAARDACARARQVLERELCADVDNPLIDADGWSTNNAANCHAQALAEALDLARTSATAQAVASERRCARLLDPAMNGGLPAFLIPPDAVAGVSSGLMIAQYTAAALVAELRLDAAPAAIQSMPVCAGTEDLAPMGALAARRLRAAIARAETVVAIEILAAGQALDLGGVAPTPGLRAAHEALRSAVPPPGEDRLVGDDIAAVVELLRAGAFA